MFAPKTQELLDEFIKGVEPLEYVAKSCKNLDDLRILHEGLEAMQMTLKHIIRLEEMHQ